MSPLARNIDWPASGESSGCHGDQIDKVNQLSVRIPSDVEQASVAILILYCCVPDYISWVHCHNCMCAFLILLVVELPHVA